MRDHESPERAAGEGELDLAAVADRLRAEGEEVRARLTSMTADLEALMAASQDSNADDEHDPEGQTIAYERSQLSSLVDAAHAQLSRVEATLARVRSGGYGRCDVCGQPIPLARLEARPTARTCVAHAVAGRG
jgi:RNA polymerase-binding transcription factor DksA